MRGRHSWRSARAEFVAGALLGAARRAPASRPSGAALHLLDDILGLLETAATRLTVEFDRLDLPARANRIGYVLGQVGIGIELDARMLQQQINLCFEAR